MSNNLNKNNMVDISGKIASEIEFNHKVYSEGFYVFFIDVPRLSNCFDRIPVTISERILSKEKFKVGNMVSINGQFRSHNNYDGKGSKLILSVFARSISILNDDENNIKNKNLNSVFLDGYVCKSPILRVTPFGREISDILIAVNRSYNKSDYLPCISWGRNAKYSEKILVGERIKVWGRIQSREYQKKVDVETNITKTAYEVSISKMEKCISEPCV